MRPRRGWWFWALGLALVALTALALIWVRSIEAMQAVFVLGAVALLVMVGINLLTFGPSDQGRTK